MARDINDIANDIWKKNVGAAKREGLTDRSVRVEEPLPNNTPPTGLTDLDEAYTTVKEASNGFGRVYNAIGTEEEDTTGRVVAGAVNLITRMQKDEIRDEVSDFSGEAGYMADDDDRYMVDSEVAAYAMDQAQDIVESFADGGVYALDVLGSVDEAGFNELGATVKSKYSADITGDDLEESLETWEEYGLVENNEGSYQTTEKGDLMANLLESQRKAL